MKKVFIFLTLIAVVAAFTFTVFAEEDKSPVFVVETVRAKAGDTVKVNISIKNNPGIISARLVVMIDSRLTLLNVEYGKELGGMTQMPETYESPIVLNWVSPTAELKSDTILATLTLTVPENAKNGEYSVDISRNPEDIFNLKEENVVFKLINGSVSVNNSASGTTATTTSETTAGTTATTTAETTAGTTATTTAETTTGTTATTTAETTTGTTATTTAETTTGTTASTSTETTTNTETSSATMQTESTSLTEDETTAETDEATETTVTDKQTSTAGIPIGTTEGEETAASDSTQEQQTTASAAITQPAGTTDAKTIDKNDGAKKIIIPIAIAAIVIAIVTVTLLVVKKK